MVWTRLISAQCSSGSFGLLPASDGFTLRLSPSTDTLSEFGKLNTVALFTCWALWAKKSYRLNH